MKIKPTGFRILLDNVSESGLIYEFSTIFFCYDFDENLTDVLIFMIQNIFCFKIFHYFFLEKPITFFLDNLSIYLFCEKPNFFDSIQFRKINKKVVTFERRGACVSLTKTEPKLVFTPKANTFGFVQFVVFGVHPTQRLAPPPPIEISRRITRRLTEFSMRYEMVFICMYSNLI